MPENYKKEFYEDKILIKLRRKYSKDEIIGALNKKIEFLELEKGKLLSEIEHLEYIIRELKSSFEKRMSESVRDSPLYLEQQKILKKRGELINKLMAERKKNN